MVGAAGAEGDTSGAGRFSAMVGGVGGRGVGFAAGASTRGAGSACTTGAGGGAGGRLARGVSWTVRVEVGSSGCGVADDG